MNIVNLARQRAVEAIAAMIKRAVLILKKEKGRQLVIVCQGRQFAIDGNDLGFLEFHKAIATGRCLRKLNCPMFMARTVAGGTKKCWQLHECSCFLKKHEQCDCCWIKKEGESLC